MFPTDKTPTTPQKKETLKINFMYIYTHTQKVRLKTMGSPM